MSKVLFMNFPSHGHVNPTLGLAAELVKRGETVDYTCTEVFREKIEKTGANYKNYGGFSDDFFRHKQTQNIKDTMDFFAGLVSKTVEVVNRMLADIGNTKYDYIVGGSSNPYSIILSKVLKVPTVSSFAIFATPQQLVAKNTILDYASMFKSERMTKIYEENIEKLDNAFHTGKIPFADFCSYKGNLNIAYTSAYFAGNDEFYKDNFVFIGPPIYERKEQIDFPFDRLKGKKVMYISLGTVFNDTSDGIYDMFFKAFGSTDYTVVMSAYRVDVSKFDVPSNFIVRNYVPQSEILKYTDVAITHAGMNSISDLIYNEVPFVCVPIAADQPCNASRAAELGATISLDARKLSPEILRDSVEKVVGDPSYLSAIRKISESFKQAGGYEKGGDEIFDFKARAGIR